MQAGRIARAIVLFFFSLAAGAAAAQDTAARQLLESSAQAIGGLQRLRGIDNIVLTGFGQSLSQMGGGNLSANPRAPAKLQVVTDAERVFDLRNNRAMYRSRVSSVFPFAIERGLQRGNQLQTDVAMLDHPVPALLTALASGTTLGAVHSEDNLLVVEFTIAAGNTLWLGIDPNTRFPAWLRWIQGDSALGDVTYTTYFTGYLPFDDLWLPVGLVTAIDWRDTTLSELHVDSYRIDADDIGPVPTPARGVGGGNAQAEAAKLADGVWDVRIGGNGGAVIEFEDHLTMFEAYAGEAPTFARLDLANTLVPGKQVTEVIVSHHHFDHAGGLRAAVARGLTVISHRGNEEIFREMVARPAPNFPDALARNPQPLKFVPVDEHLVLEDSMARVDVYHAVGHLHMAEAVIAYVPEHRIFLEGDFTTFDWQWHWWGGAYLDTVERYNLDPAINVPVHGIVTTFDEAISAIETQVRQARQHCEDKARAGVYEAGCPVQYSGERGE
jgi:glyoxylase-like metal-dependent hydrolase (beta-lactamase superfamily II)